MARAVSAAEQYAGGKSTRPEHEQHKSQWVYDVEVVKDTKVTDVKVNPSSGRIIAAVEDKSDHDDDIDKAD